VALNDFKEVLTVARAEYFRAANTAIEKIQLRFGEGRDGFLNFLNNNDVGSIKPQDKSND
jgi:hypothetical protein